MSQNEDLINLKNIGKKIAVRLNGVGIISKDDLKLIGAVGAYRLI